MKDGMVRGQAKGGLPPRHMCSAWGVVRGDLVVTRGRSRVPVPSGLSHALGGAGREEASR